MNAHTFCKVTAAEATQRLQGHTGAYASGRMSNSSLEIATTSKISLAFIKIFLSKFKGKPSKKL